MTGYYTSGNDFGAESSLIVYCFKNASGVEDADSISDGTSNTTGTGVGVTPLGRNRFIVNIGIVGVFSPSATLNAANGFYILNNQPSTGGAVLAGRPKYTAAAVTAPVFNWAGSQTSAAFGFALVPLKYAPPPFINRSMQHMLVR